MGVSRTHKGSSLVKRPPEEVAGLEARCRMVMKYYGGRARFAKHFGLSYATVKNMKRITHPVATMIHNDRSLGIRLRASFCRPDLKFNIDGTLKGSALQGARKRVFT